MTTTRILALVALMFALSVPAADAQLFTGISGLLQTPSAEMHDEGDARVGAHFLNHAVLPRGYFDKGKAPYNTGGFYVAITPFEWAEMSYSFNLIKGYHYHMGQAGSTYGLYHKDEFLSFKVRPLREGRWWPAVALGTNDPATNSKGKYGTTNQFYGNFYIAATKHFRLWHQTFGTTLSYRRYLRDFNHRWNGVVGGITYRPSFFPDARAVVEWTGEAVNAGIDCVLFRHLIVQASLYDGQYFSGGLCYKVNLF